MVGGLIEQIEEVEDGELFVMCRGIGVEQKSTCGVRVKPGLARFLMKQGDRFWWQGRRAFWTPAPERGLSSVFVDVPLERTGYSTDKLPSRRKLEGLARDMAGKG
jgi:hypothetical protein